MSHSDDLSPFGIRIDERVAVFIDGPNLYAAAKAAAIQIDYKVMLSHFEDESRFLRAYYYTAIPDNSEDYSPIRPLIDWLGYNGFSMVTKSMKEFTDETGRQRHKGNMDIELAVDALTLADKLDHVILFSGDGDFRRLVEALQAKACRVTVVSTMKGGTSMIADELRRQADKFVDLHDLRHLIAAPPKAARE